MILDHLSRWSAYAVLNPRLAAAFHWLERSDWQSIPDGRHEIDGEKLFVSVESGITFEPDLRRFESHRRYLDIQLSISGGERMGFWPGAELKVAEQAGPDCWFHKSPKNDGLMLPVPPGFFAVFMPGEAHKPCCHLDEDPAPFRKCVVKVEWPSA